MGLSLVRFTTGRSAAAWALREGELARPLRASWCSTAEVLAAADALRGGLIDTDEPVPLDSLDLCSPVTRPCQVFAQAMNYKGHMAELGRSLRDCRDNILFRLSSASIGGPFDPVCPPAHVALFDYEVELGFVVGRPITEPTRVTDAQLSDFIGAFVLTNDLSARDVHVPEGQMYKGKSYRGFTPCGPVLFLPDPDEVARWPELRLRLSVNGEVRQDELAGDMIHGPAATLSELSLLEDLAPGDLLLTGTPGGVALSPPGRLVQALAGFLPEARKWEIFRRGQASKPGYLAPGDVVEAHIRTDDGAIDLGSQRIPITAPG